MKVCNICGLRFPWRAPELAIVNHELLHRIIRYLVKFPVSTEKLT